MFLALLWNGNKKEYHLNTTNTTTNSTFAFVLIAVILSSVAVIATSSISTMHRVDAQMSNSSNMAGSMMSNGKTSSEMGSNMMAIPAKAPVLNITTAPPPITPTTFKSMESQMHVDLIKATMIAEKWIGSNSHAVSSMVGIQNGSPVYTIWVIDNNSGLHQIVVDPQNGKIMFANQPMSMIGPFS